MPSGRTRPSHPVWLIVLVVLIGACDYNINLQRGYFVACVYAGAFTVVAPDRRCLTPVSRRGMTVAVAGDLIVGQVDPPEDDRDPAGNDYFIVDTISGRAWIHLAVDEYRKRLVEMDVMKPPRLRKANRFTTLFIRQSPTYTSALADRSRSAFRPAPLGRSDQPPCP